MQHHHEEQPVLTVTELNLATKDLLESHWGNLLIEGEISNFVTPASGHWYFSLKDSNAQVRCAMFRLNNRQVACTPENGMQVLLKATVSLYPNRGDYQLIVEQLHDIGAGQQQQQFEALKKQLHKEGLFDQKHKKTLPELPSTIGIITSATGAALQDILRVLKRRYPVAKLILYPTQVQGDQASITLTHMINLASKRRECDVLILARGGGSAEDLSCFNDEMLARALFACPIPTVTGVGHDIDTTLVDFIADVAAPTPSAAAETVSPDRYDLLDTLDGYRDILSERINNLCQQQTNQLQWLTTRLEQQHPKQQLMQQQQQLDHLSEQLQQRAQTALQHQQQRLTLVQHAFQAQHPGTKIQHTQQRLNHAWQRLRQAADSHLEQRKTQLKLMAQTLQALSPLTTLARGYSVTTDTHGNIITKTTQVQSGDTIVTTLDQGKLISVIKTAQ